MIRFNKHPVMRITAVVLTFVFLVATMPASGAGDNSNKLEGMFQWAKKFYIDGKYRESNKNLKILLSLCDENDKEFVGKVHLLLGAANEKIGNIDDAEKHYQLAQNITNQKKIKDVDFGDLNLYLKVIGGGESRGWVIAKEIPKPKKPKKSTFLVLLGMTAVAVTAVLLLKAILKKNPTNDYNYDTRSLGIEWVEIGGDQFFMGDETGKGEMDETPSHLVILDRYNISKHEITVRQFEVYLKDSKRTVSQGDDTITAVFGAGNQPAINITWREAQGFCKWLSEKTGKDINLPTEAQWEFAARGKERNLYPWGNSAPNCQLANHCCMDRTVDVRDLLGGKTPTGILNMAGNVAEWCHDYYDESYYDDIEDGAENPTGPDSSGDGREIRVVRGGSWQCGGTLRCTDRSYKLADDSEAGKYDHVGFRIVWQDPL